MKIALCFAGQPRNIENSFRRWIKPNLIDANSHHEIDTFVHLWYDQSQEGTSYINAGNHPCSLPVPTDVLNLIYRLYNPISMNVERPRSFEYPESWEINKYPDIKITSSLSRMYSTLQVINTCTQYGKSYDIIGIGRFDSILNGPVVLDNCNEHGIFDMGLAPHGINIVWVFGPPGDIITYANLINYIPAIMDDGIRFCDEYIIRHYLDKLNIPLIPLNISSGLNTEH